ncbi:MAG TPA: hypothetical protein PLZ43_11435, partial [bacterium]|nr:hypothetical protein [bacterium]
MKKWYSKYIDFSSRWYGLIIILLFALMTGEFLYLKDNLKIDTDLKALFNGANETVIQLQEMEEKVGSYSTILVVASSPDREKNIQAL